MLRTAFHNELLVIGFTPEHLILCWLKKSSRFSIVVCAYRSIACTADELYNGCMYNQTRISQLINQFVTEHQLHHVYAAWWINGPLIVQRLVRHFDAFAQQQEFAQYSQNAHIWDYRYIHPNDDGSFTFYLACMPQWVLLQYQLMAHKTSSNVVTCTTQHMALLQLYRFIHADSFRPTKLAYDLAQQNNKLEQLFNWPTLAQMVHIDKKITFDQKTDLPFLLPACGLFVSEGTTV